MKKFSGQFTGVPDGEVYPRMYEKGDECPPELEEAATEAGVLDGVKASRPGENKAARPSENK